MEELFFAHEKTVYGIRFQNNPYPFVINLWNIGWEIRDNPSYNWDGSKRNESHVVFQYTLSGYGSIEINGQLYSVGPQEAFLVSLPSDHRYYFSKEANEPWEFIFVTLEGDEALRIQDAIVQQHGPVLSINRDSETINLLFKLYFDTASGNLTDAFIGSMKAYEFITSLLRQVNNRQKRALKDTIAKVVNHIETSFSDPLTLDELAYCAGLSKYHFIKQFKEELDITPMQYVAVIRIKKAAVLLSQTEASISEIAYSVGYNDPNYFNKVFKKIAGTSASVFRQTSEKSILTEW